MAKSAVNAEREQIMSEVKRVKIEGTPLSMSVYSVEEMPTRKNEHGVLEIIMCLKGSVQFSYYYEEFTLNEGEYIAVDIDAYFFKKGRDNLCVSFYINLLEYTDKYPLINYQYFVCEGTKETEVKDYPTVYHERLRGLLYMALKNINEGKTETVKAITDTIVDMFVKHYSIVVYHYGSEDISAVTMERMIKTYYYFSVHYNEKIRLKDVADSINITEGYLSELMRKYSIGFKNMLGYIRANLSEKLLLETDGFSDVKYYYTAFRDWYKCTPKQFRDVYRRIDKEIIERRDIKDAVVCVDKLVEEHYNNIILGEVIKISEN
ncbi:MAG: hypothetical protein Q4D99_02720 [Bacillota bacterium]|nr:hypothetical protein [Bacillota bacterium]